jgi:molybdopterin-guanine dinucleotide biosynthesis protein A
VSLRSGIILSGGASTRIGQEKGLVKLKDKPLISWVIDRIKDVTDEIIVVVGSEEDIPQYWAFVPDDVQVISDFYHQKSPLIGLISGLRKAKGQYAVVCACDMPFLNPVILEMMFCVSYDLNGTLLVKPNGWIEPLPSVYNVSNCLECAELLRRIGELRIRKVLENMSDVVRLPVEKLREIDPELVSFIDLDTINSVKNAESLIYKVT